MDLLVSAWQTALGFVEIQGWPAVQECTQRAEQYKEALMSSSLTSIWNDLVSHIHHFFALALHKSSAALVS